MSRSGCNSICGGAKTAQFGDFGPEREVVTRPVNLTHISILYCFSYIIPIFAKSGKRTILAQYLGVEERKAIPVLSERQIGGVRV